MLNKCGWCYYTKNKYYNKDRGICFSSALTSSLVVFTFYSTHLRKTFFSFLGQHQRQKTSSSAFLYLLSCFVYPLSLSCYSLNLHFFCLYVFVFYLALLCSVKQPWVSWYVFSNKMLLEVLWEWLWFHKILTQWDLWYNRHKCVYNKSLGKAGTAISQLSLENITVVQLLKPGGKHYAISKYVLTQIATIIFFHSEVCK